MAVERHLHRGLEAGDARGGARGRQAPPEQAGHRAGGEEQDGAEAEGRSPVGSDLWLEEFAAEGSLERQFSFPEGGDMSVLLATDGTAPAPTEISVTWPIDSNTPQT